MRNILSLLAIAAVLSFPAAAGIITIGPYSDNVGVSDTPRTDMLNLQYFDSNLGNLIQVDIVLQGSVEGTIEVNNSGSNTPKTVSGNLSANLELFAPDGTTSLLTVLTSSGFGPTVVPGGAVQVVAATNQAGNNVLTINNPLLLAQFVQSGGGVMPLKVDVTSLITGLTVIGGGVTLIADIDASSFASVEYTYETKDVVVPEPSVMFLSGAGLIGLALLGRKRYPGRQ